MEFSSIKLDKSGKYQLRAVKLAFRDEFGIRTSSTIKQIASTNGFWSFASSVSDLTESMREVHQLLADLGVKHTQPQKILCIGSIWMSFSSYNPERIHHFKEIFIAFIAEKNLTQFPRYLFCAVGLCGVRSRKTRRIFSRHS
jgi:hypothetical protein